MIEKLLLVEGLPQVQVQDYFIACLSALVELLCDGCKGADLRSVREQTSGQ